MEQRLSARQSLGGSATGTPRLLLRGNEDIDVEVVEPATSATSLNTNNLIRYICRYTPATSRYIFACGGAV